MKIKKLIMRLSLFITTLIQSQSVFAIESVSSTINDGFENVTGWFVSFIFAPMPGTAFPWIVTWLVTGAVVFYFIF